MRTLRTLFWGIVAICLVVIGIANREMVSLRALPEPLADLFGVSPDITLPLFVVLFLGVALGLLIGFVWEFLREHRLRVEGRRHAREHKRLEREIHRMAREKHEGPDDVLALVETPPRRR